MTAFRPGDLAQVVTGSRFPSARLEPGDLVMVIDVRDDCLLVTCALGEPTRSLRFGTFWTVTADALRLVPADEQGDTTPAPSLRGLLIAALTAVLENRVSIEQQWHDPSRSTYRIVIEEKA